MATEPELTQYADLLSDANPVCKTFIDAVAANALTAEMRNCYEQVARQITDDQVTKVAQALAEHDQLLELGGAIRHQLQLVQIACRRRDGRAIADDPDPLQGRKTLYYHAVFFLEMILRGIRPSVEIPAEIQAAEPAWKRLHALPDDTEALKLIAAAETAVLLLKTVGQPAPKTTVDSQPAVAAEIRPETAPRSPNVPTIYYEIEGEFAVLSDAQNVRSEIKVCELKLLRPYLNNETGFPLDPPPSAEAVCDALAFRYRPKAKRNELKDSTREVTERTASVVLNDNLSRLKSSIRAGFESEDEPQDSDLHHLTEHGFTEVVTPGLRRARFRLLPATAKPGKTTV